MQENAETLPRILTGEQSAQFLDSRGQARLAAEDPDFSLNRLYYHSDGAGRRLRVGVLIDGSSAPLFMRKVLEDVRNCDFADLVAVIENVEPVTQRAARASMPARIAKQLLDKQHRQRLLHLAYHRWLDRRHAPDPRARVDCSDLFGDAQRIRVSPLRKGFVDRFPPEAIEQIVRLDVDVLLRFGFRIIRGDILSVARHGVWSFHHGDSERYRGGPALLWELIENNPLSGAVLQRLDESLDAGPVMCRAILATCERSVSMNRYNVYWSTQHLVIQKLNELHRYGAEHLARRTAPPHTYHGKRAIYRKPTNLEMARWLVPTLARTAVRKVAAPKEVLHWRIGLRKRAAPAFLAPAAGTIGEFSWLDSPRGHFWADPFLIEEGGATWMFFEDFSYTDKRGVIACARVEQGKLQDVRTVLSRPYHVSYPYLFKHEGSVWMIPESSSAGQVQLYRARRFPDEWVFERTLLDVPGVDSSIFEFQGRWLMFVSPLIVKGCAPTTLLFTAPDPCGPWTMHPAGTICSDVRWARCAGQIIRVGERILRPSQDCSIMYGHSVTFNELTQLDDETYAEKRGAQLLPDPRHCVFGVHTYNRAGDWEAIDGRTRMRRSSIR